jgi:hypothetical protein
MPTNSRPDPGRGAAYIVHAGRADNDGESMYASLRPRHLLRDSDRAIGPGFIAARASRCADGGTRATATRASRRADGGTRATATRASRRADGGTRATATRASPNADGRTRAAATSTTCLIDRGAGAAAEQSGSSPRAVIIRQQHNLDDDTSNNCASAVQSSAGAATNRPLQSAQYLQSDAWRTTQASQRLQYSTSESRRPDEQRHMPHYQRTDDLHRLSRQQLYHCRQFLRSDYGAGGQERRTADVAETQRRAA